MSTHIQQKSEAFGLACNLVVLKGSVVHGSGCGNDVDAPAVLVELNFAIHKREEGPIAAGADVLARGELRPALADENAAGGNEFPAITLHTEPFARAVAPVT